MTNEEAQMLIEIAKRLRNHILNFPSPGGKEYYHADDLTKIRKFTIQAFSGKRGAFKPLVFPVVPQEYNPIAC